MELSSMTLYYKPTCPFCVRVLDFMDDRGIELETKNTLDPKNFNELKSLNNGITQVPCLSVDGEPMLESSDIIDFLGRAAEE